MPALLLMLATSPHDHSAHARDLALHVTLALRKAARLHIAHTRTKRSARQSQAYPTLAAGYITNPQHQIQKLKVASNPHRSGKKVKTRNAKMDQTLLKLKRPSCVLAGSANVFTIGIILDLGLQRL